MIKKLFSRNKTKTETVATPEFPTAEIARQLSKEAAINNYKLQLEQAKPFVESELLKVYHKINKAIRKGIDYTSYDIPNYTYKLALRDLLIEDLQKKGYRAKEGSYFDLVIMW
jgi:hypothetical protein